MTETKSIAGERTQTKTTHTPGPWVVGEDNDVFSFGGCVARIVDAPDGAPQPLANSRLIASAPELIEALKAIQARIVGDFDNPALLKFGPLSTDSASDLYEIARTAINKAEGK